MGLMLEHSSLETGFLQKSNAFNTRLDDNLGNMRGLLKAFSSLADRHLWPQLHLTKNMEFSGQMSEFQNARCESSVKIHGQYLK